MTGSSICSISDGVGPARGIVDLDDAAVGERDVVAHAGRGGDEVEIVLALEALLNDFEWSRPRKPQRKPKPRATEDSGSKEKDASLRRSFSRASRSMACSCESTV